MARTVASATSQALGGSQIGERLQASLQRLESLVRRHREARPDERAIDPGVVVGVSKSRLEFFGGSRAHGVIIPPQSVTVEPLLEDEATVLDAGRRSRSRASAVATLAAAEAREPPRGIRSMCRRDQFRSRAAELPSNRTITTEFRRALPAGLLADCLAGEVRVAP